MAAEVVFESADKAGTRVVVPAHPQTAVSPGPNPNTAIINSPNGQRACVVGDYREIEAQLQAAAARAHEDGTAPRKNTPVS